MEEIVESLFFEVEALSQENLVNGQNKAQTTPVNVKVRLRKKNDKGPYHRGFVSVSKFDSSSMTPGMVKIINSDQTILSFDLVIEKGKDSFKSKPRRKNFNLFGSGGCFSKNDNNDDDDYSYLPRNYSTTCLTKMKDSDIRKTSVENFYEINKVASTEIDNRKEIGRRPKKLFGDCKPGLGWYNIKYCLVLALFLIAGIIESIGYSYLLPTAKCDLDMNDYVRGIIGSMPYIAIVATSFVWGYLVDTIGRKTSLIYSSLACSAFGIIAAFMPELISFTILKFLAALCLACPAAAPYTLIGEILPPKVRDLALSITNAMQIMGAGLVPVLGWLIIPADITIDFGIYDFRSWRVLALVYSASLIVPAVLMIFGPESPKYLVVQGKQDKALKILQIIYARNHKKSLDDFPVVGLKLSNEIEKEKTSFLVSLKEQSVPLFKPPHLKWMALSGMLLFGIFSILNGLFIWAPDVVNRVFTGDSDGLTACQVIVQRLNETTVETVCDDSIDEMTFMINTIANVTCAFAAILTSTLLRFIGKKIFLIFLYAIFGCVCISINFVTNSIWFAVLLSSMQLIAVGIGPVNAFAIAIFPTKLRGMAIGLGLMIGRMGSVIGANVTGILLNNACEATFYMFGGLLLLCCLASLLLPRLNTTVATPIENPKMEGGNLKT